MNNIKFFFLVASIFILSNLFCEDATTDPSWVYLNRAENLKEKKDYAMALIEAKKARQEFIKEKLDIYNDQIREKYKNKVAYELTNMIRDKEKELIANDNYPQYHELAGDIYVLTGMLDVAEKEYKSALSQSKYFEFQQENIEIKYKLAGLYHKKLDFELEDITYREITKEFFDKKAPEFWDRLQKNINDDPTLSRVFKIYRIDGIEYLEALYKIGRRSAMLQRKSEALYFLSISADIWMTYNASLIKKTNFDFQFASPEDFINYISKKRIFEYNEEQNQMDYILFFIGYVFLLDKQDKIKDHFFNLALIFSKNTSMEEEIKKRIDYFKKDENHILTYDEFLN
jgi:hypothetical protein